MKRFDSEKRKKKVLCVKHETPGDFCLDYVLLPFGYAYNADAAAAKGGDTIRFFDGGEFRIVCCKRLPIKSQITELLCRMRYGVTLAGAVSRWKSNAKLEGHSASVISDEKCLMIVYEQKE